MERVSFFINRVANYISIVAMMLLTLLTVADVFGRYLFNKPIPGTLEVTELALVIIVFLAVGYAEHYNDHIVIDTVYELLPKTIKNIVYLFSSVLTFVVIILMGWQLYVYSERMLAGGYNTAVLVAAFGSICYALAQFSNIVTFIGKGWGGKKE